MTLSVEDTTEVDSLFDDYVSMSPKVRKAMARRAIRLLGYYAAGWCDRCKEFPKPNGITRSWRERIQCGECNVCQARKLLSALAGER